MTEEPLHPHTTSAPAETPPSAGVPRPGLRRMLAPLKVRDFRLLWTGFTISVLGDGLYFVAIAWEVYRISNVPTALSTVGVAWTLPMILFVLIGGVITDRFDRR